MAFKVVFHAPDADPEKNRCVVETSKCKLFVVEVKSQDQAVEVCRDLVKREKVDFIILCPGFAHKEVAQLSEVAGGNVGVFVAREMVQVTELHQRQDKEKAIEVDKLTERIIESLENPFAKIQIN